MHEVVLIESLIGRGNILSVLFSSYKESILTIDKFKSSVASNVLQNGTKCDNKDPDYSVNALIRRKSCNSITIE